MLLPERGGSGMRRRTFIRLAGCLAVWPVATLAQQSGRVRRVGVLMAYPESDQEGQTLVATLHETLRKLGWIEGSNVHIDVRWGSLEDSAALSRSAKELMAFKPEVIVTQNTPATAAMRQQTNIVPI